MIIMYLFTLFTFLCCLLHGKTRQNHIKLHTAMAHPQGHPLSEGLGWRCFGPGSLSLFFLTLVNSAAGDLATLDIGSKTVLFSSCICN